MTEQDSQPRTKPRPLSSGKSGKKRTVSTTTNATEPSVPTGPEAPAAPEPAPEPAAPAEASVPRADPAPAAASDRLRYDDLLRKETRLREDQVDELNALARRLARDARRTRGANDPAERITDNTLIRAAVDLLLDRSDKVKGKTEAQIRRSVGLKDPK